MIEREEIKYNRARHRENARLDFLYGTRKIPTNPCLMWLRVRRLQTK